MILKKLPKEVVSEGITVELFNKINMDNFYSPVQLQPNDEPVKLMKCATGYWVMIDDETFLRDEKNKLIVFGEKECQIGRARYLLSYGVKEKEQKVNDLIDYWDRQVQAEIGKLANAAQPPSGGVFSDILEHLLSDEQKQHEEAKRELAKKAYKIATEAYQEGRIIELLASFKIKRFDNPMLTARYDNPDEMRVLINTFNKDQIDKWDGDMLKKYAQIEVEKQYPF